MPTLPRFEIIFDSGKVEKEVPDSRFLFATRRSALCRVCVSAIAAALVLRRRVLVSFVATTRGGAASKAASARSVSTKTEVASMASGAGVVSSRCCGCSSSTRAVEVQPPGCSTMEGWGGVPPLPPLPVPSLPRAPVSFAGEVGVPGGECHRTDQIIRVQV